MSLKISLELLEPKYDNYPIKYSNVETVHCSIYVKKYIQNLEEYFSLVIKDASKGIDKKTAETNSYKKYYNYEYDIYIRSPYFVHIIVYSNGDYKIYKNDISIPCTSENYFDNIYMIDKPINVDLDLVTSYILIHKIMHNRMMYNIMKINNTTYDEYIDGFTFIKYFLANDIKLFAKEKHEKYEIYMNKYISNDELKDLNTDIFMLKLEIPTFEELYGFSNQS
jgi:hypothetical protein